jgi:flavin reductase (DIM6/NTAB) family NADH-FMN oxidoreductase RutF
VSVDPPTVLVSLASDSRSARAIAATQRFGVSVLAAEQLGVARFGSMPGVAKFLEPFAESADGLGASPAVAGALAHLDCDVSEAVEVADHTVFFGHAAAVRAPCDGLPLLYHGRGYRTLADDSPTERSTRCLAN